MDTLNNSMNMHKGFTLLELIIVIIILGILAAIGVTNYTNSIEKARGEAYINNMRTILNAWRIYNLKEAIDYNPIKGSNCSVSWINNNFRIFITESYYGYGTTIPGARLTSNLTAADTHDRYLRARGNRIGNLGRWVQCNYYYLRDATQWEWTGGNFPWLPADE